MEAEKTHWLKRGGTFKEGVGGKRALRGFRLVGKKGVGEGPFLYFPQLGKFFGIKGGVKFLIISWEPFWRGFGRPGKGFIGLGLGTFLPGFKELILFDGRNWGLKAGEARRREEEGSLKKGGAFLG